MIKRLRQHAADADQRRILHEDIDAGNLRELRPQFLDDLVRAQFTVGAGFQTHEHPAVVGADGGTARADGGHERGDVRIGPDDFCGRHLVRAESFKRSVLRDLGDAKNLAGVFVREKTFRNDDEQKNRHHKNCERN